MSAPATARAVVIKSKGVAAVETVPVPKLRDDYILVKTRVVGVNPTDWKHVHGDMPPVGARVGCDYAGVVVQVGSKVTKDFKPGDRICGLASGSNSSQHEDGAWGEYIVVKGDCQLKTPDNITDEEAATMGVAVGTVGQGLYQALKLPLPTQATINSTVPPAQRTPILIYGGSTAMGIFGIQLAKLSGWRVLSTASPKNFDYLRSLGVDELFDYSDPSWPDDVYRATGGKLRYAWDCVSEGNTPGNVAKALDRDEPGAAYAATLFINADEMKVANPKIADPIVTMAYTVFGEAFDKFGRTWPAKPEDFEHMKLFVGIVEGLLAEGKLKPIRSWVDRDGHTGLEGAVAGMRELMEGRVSGGKLVYRV